MMGKRKKGKQIRVQGWDLSLNHCGMVELVNGELGNFWYVTDIVGSFKRIKQESVRSVATLLPAKEKHEDAGVYEVRRLQWWQEYLESHALLSSADYVGVEGYAMDNPRRAHQIGELGGLARLACWKANVAFRIHDPMSIKLFAAHYGHADKPRVEKVVCERWGADFSRCNPPPSKQGKVNRQTSEDLADAFSIAKLVWYEVCLRNGLTTLSELHPKEIQVFNRVTKGYPVNILGREWIDAERS